ncbi:MULTISPECIES: hypothetical protein [Kitasatospora]|uniref:Uncharacterized protein n=2 Tax=Kitasatospora TaxID=2063 RepID=A0ABT1J004_9ACTN|nr:hypothetical protein [Kitasatospora paracochleata]MCP2310717.1 hypothetical protein [Kitasatospora paracochleata]
MRTGIRSALKYAENVLIRGARRNAWAAVCENRRWAEDRAQAGEALRSRSA